MDELFNSLKKYNYWDGNMPNLGISRHSYLEKCSGYIGNPLIKVLIGQRRSGKSYLLRQLMHKIIQSGVSPKNIFYLNKELVAFAEVRTYQDLAKLIDFYKKQMTISGKVYVFLDEVQEIQEWEKIVNSLAQDPTEVYELFITGSNSTMLSTELSSLLSGRYVLFDVFPFSYVEYCEAYGMVRNKESYISYMTIGGLPELKNISDMDARRQYVSAVRDSILLNDIVDRFSIKDSVLLQDIFSYCADNIGGLFSINSIVQYLHSHGRKTSHETVSSYLSHLCNAFLLHEVERYDVRGKAVLARQRKYYLNDTAFRSFLSSGYDPAPGKLLENCLYLYYRSLGYHVYVGVVGSVEVDFVIEKDNERQYVQASYLLSDDAVIAREFGALEKIKDNFPKLVITLDDASFGTRHGILHLRPWEL